MTANVTGSQRPASRVRGTIKLGPDSQQSRPSVIKIANGPTFMGYIDTVSKKDDGSDSAAIFTIASPLNRYIDRMITIEHSEFEDGSGRLFNFRGTWRRPGRVTPGQHPLQRIKGFYNTKTREGWIQALD